MESMKHICGVAMQVLIEGGKSGWWSVVQQFAVQHAAAIVPKMQYLFGYEGVGNSYLYKFAVPSPQLFPLIHKCSKNVNDLNCCSAVVSSFNKRGIFSYPSVVCPVAGNRCFMRTTSGF